MRSRLLAGLVAIAVGVVSGVCSAQARSTQPERRAGWDGDAFLLVTASTDDPPGLDLALDFGYDAPPGRVTLYVPKGFDVYPSRPVGLPVGTAEIVAGSSSYGSFSFARFLGQIQADSLLSPLMAEAQHCWPGAYTALWSVSLSILGQPVEVPLTITPTGTGDPADSAYRIDFCPPAIPSPNPAAAPVLPMQSLELFFTFLTAPTQRGLYVWHGLVTPLAPDERTTLAGQTYEVRSTVPTPHRLTLSGRRGPKATAILRGMLSAAGRPEPHKLVAITRLVRKILPSGRVAFLDSLAGTARTNAHGAYSLRVSLRSTSGFTAEIGDEYTRCSPPAFAPASCVTSTTAGTTSTPITLSVPRRARR